MAIVVTVGYSQEVGRVNDESNYTNTIDTGATATLYPFGSIGEYTRRLRLWRLNEHDTFNFSTETL